MGALEPPLRIGQEYAVDPAEMDVDRLGHHPREEDRAAADGHVVADDLPAGPDASIARERRA